MYVVPDLLDIFQIGIDRVLARGISLVQLLDYRLREHPGKEPLAIEVEMQVIDEVGGGERLGTDGRLERVGRVDPLYLRLRLNVGAKPLDKVSARPEGDEVRVLCGLPCSSVPDTAVELCPRRPESNAYKMLRQMQQYFAEHVQFNYLFSYYTIKSKLKASYIDDGRPTEISRLNAEPPFYCLFAGKVNSIFPATRILERF